jgi:hypothetical protein
MPTFIKSEIRIQRMLNNIFLISLGFIFISGFIWEDVVEDFFFFILLISVLFIAGNNWTLNQVEGDVKKSTKKI